MNNYPIVFLCVSAMLVLWTGLLILLLNKRESRGWVIFDEYSENRPPVTGTVVAYPVAAYAPEYGVIVDMADWVAGQWRLTGSGDPVRPFAWYDLPRPPNTVPSVSKP